MRIRSNVMVALAVLALAGVALAETVHQTTSGDKLYTGAGKNAVSQGTMETKTVDGAKSESGKVARVKGDMAQWGFVTAWFGQPAPKGKSTIRVRIYNDGAKTAKYFLYTRDKTGQNMIGPLKIPADAKENTFVDVDIPVDASAEWSGLTIKKADTSKLASPWIDTISIVLPDD